jgi:hypothetical protein
MDNNDIQFVKKNLDILDKSKLTYYNYINSTDVILKHDNDNSIIFKKNNEIIYSGKFSLFGLFDINTKIWIWSWCVPHFTFNETISTRKILEYGLTLEPKTNSSIQHYIKSHLVNSRLFFENEIFLDIHLGLSLYLSKAKFIYSQIKNNINDKIIIYYLVY